MPSAKSPSTPKYERLVADLSRLLEDARRASARAVNTVITSTYWEFGRRIVEFEQGGEARAGDGDELMRQLARDLTGRLGRGFSVSNLQNFRAFFLNWPIHRTVSGESTRGGQPEFPLPWSHYVRLMTVKEEAARRFYETEVWSGLLRARGKAAVGMVERRPSRRAHHRGCGTAGKRAECNGWVR